MIELNKVLMAGNLTRDPELRYIPSGTAVCDLRIAAGRTWYDRDSREKREETLFIDVTAWGKTAEFCNEYMKKGKGIFVEGRLKLDTWKDKEGNNRERYGIVADRVQFVESRSSERDRDSAPAAARGPRDDPGDPGPPRESEAPAATRDDLPF